VHVTELAYQLTNDVLFKMIFAKYPHLLKRFVEALPGSQGNSVKEFAIDNPEIPPEVVGEKFCRLDICVTADGRKIDLEVQREKESFYPERSLYYWARVFSSSLKEGMHYSDLPNTILINILGFKLFDYAGFHSEFQALESSRYSMLTERMSLIYYELPKLPKVINAEDELGLWLALFKAKTEEDLSKLEDLGGAIMKQAIEAYHEVSATDRFKEIERLRDKARVNEMYALKQARHEERAKWQEVIKEKDAVLAENVSALAEKDSALAEKDSALAKKDSALAEKDLENEQLRKLIAELRAQNSVGK
jgi:predicted transposase/invertase (TIGR01784 family)